MPIAAQLNKDEIRKCHASAAGPNASKLDVPDPQPVWQWAEANRMMPSEVTAASGPFRISLTPWMKEPSESVDDPTVTTTVLCFASRLGKTELFLNIIGRTIHEFPRNVLLLYPTIDSCKKWSREFFTPMVESSPCFRGLIANPRARSGDNTTLSKRFPGGRISAIGANSPSGFRQIQAPVILCDEIDAMETTREGDPITLAFKRAENYRECIQVLASTPTRKGISRIWYWLEQSDFRKWHVPSPFTGNWHVLDWANVKWEPGQLENAAYTDPDTGDPWTEQQRRDAVMAGEWRATRESTGVRGYWGDALMSLFAPKKGYKSKYHQWAVEFLDAKHKGPDALEVWNNTFRAQPWEEEVEQLEWEFVSNRAEEYETDPIPDRVLMITAACDVQADRIEIEWVGWGDDFESWGLRYAVLPGDTKRPEVWDLLEKELDRKWNHVAGPMEFARAFIDEGHNTEQVRLFSRAQLRRGREVYPCKGVPRAGVLEPELCVFNANRKQKGIKAPTWNVGVTRAKRTIYNYMLAEPPGPKTMHFPKGNGYDDNFFQMLTAETVATRFSFGQPYKVFDLPSGRRNEALDIRCYNYAAAVSLNPQWEVLRERQSGKMNVAKPPPPRHVSEIQMQNLTRPLKNESKTGNSSQGWRRSAANWRR